MLVVLEFVLLRLLCGGIIGAVGVTLMDHVTMLLIVVCFRLL